MPRREDIPDNKAQLTILIDAELYHEFRKLAFMKHGRLHGALSREMEDALKFWIACHSTDAAKPKPRPRLTCPRCGKLGTPQIHTTTTYYGRKRFIYRYYAFEHPEENRWCIIGSYISKREEAVSPLDGRPRA